MTYDIALFTGTVHPGFAQTIAGELGLPIGRMKVGKFSDGEVTVELEQSVRGLDAYVIQPSCPPDPSTSLMEMLVMIDTLKRASAKRISAVFPYYGYSRQDRRPWSARVPITAKLVADMITVAGADRLLTVDLHADQIQGFFNIPVDNLYASTVMIEDIRTRVKRPAIVSPDVGGVVRARAIAKLVEADLVIIDKRRPKSNASEVMHIIGDIKDRDCIIVDDIVDTAGTLCKASEALLQQGASSVCAYCTHAVLSGNAARNLDTSNLQELVVTDTIPLADDIYALNGRVRVLSIAPMLARSIRHIHQEDSVRAISATSISA